MKWADTQGDTHRDTQEIHVPQKMFRLTDEQICKLKKVSELRGCSQTDLIRGFIDSLDEEPPDTQGDTHRDTQEIHGAERSSGADSPARALMLATIDEFICWIVSHGRSVNLSTFSCPKWVSLVNQIILLSPLSLKNALLRRGKETYFERHEAICAHVLNPIVRWFRFCTHSMAAGTGIIEIERSGPRAGG